MPSADLKLSRFLCVQNEWIDWNLLNTLIVLFHFYLYLESWLHFTFDSLIEISLGKFVDENKVKLLKDKGLPLEGCVVVAGRTDKGVTALQQNCAFCMLLLHFPKCCILATWICNFWPWCYYLNIYKGGYAPMAVCLTHSTFYLVMNYDAIIVWSKRN